MITPLPSLKVPNDYPFCTGGSLTCTMILLLYKRHQLPCQPHFKVIFYATLPYLLYLSYWPSSVLPAFFPLSAWLSLPHFLTLSSHSPPFYNVLSLPRRMSLLSVLMLLTYIQPSVCGIKNTESVIPASLWACKGWGDFITFVTQGLHMPPGISRPSIHLIDRDDDNNEGGKTLHFPLLLTSFKPIPIRLSSAPLQRNSCPGSQWSPYGEIQ